MRGLVALRVSLLGPLEVMCDGVLVTPTAGKLRQLLSLLALRANTVVRTERIVEELWEATPPASVSTTLQTYIYLLRKHLNLGRSPSAEKPAEPLLETSPYSYRLSLTPGMLDALWFEQLADRGRAELEAGDLAAGSAALGEALRLWRGPALADVVCGPLLQAEVLRLEERYKGVLEGRIDADLALGRHAELLGELTSLVAEYPTHEGFPFRLMTALYRSGRRADALSVYQRLRRSLAEDLGLDPSAGIRRLHESILDSDPLLDLPGTATVATPPPPEVNMVPAAPKIVGRAHQLAEIFDLLTAPPGSQPAVVMMAGPPGSGATTICAHVSQVVRECYPDGQFFASMLDHEGRKIGAERVLEDFLRATGVSGDCVPLSLPGRVLAFQDWTRSRRVLIVLDDVTETAQLSPLLPANADSAVLVTCRRRLSIPSVSHLINIPPLTVGEGVRLLADLLGDARVIREPHRARRLVELCDGLPGALHDVAARLLVRPHWELGRMVKTCELSYAGSSPAGGSIWASVERTCRLASHRVQAALGRLTELASPVVPLSLAAATLQVDEHLAEMLLEELVELRLLEADPGEGHAKEPRYRFIPTIRHVARLLTGPAEADPLDAALVRAGLPS